MCLFLQKSPLVISIAAASSSPFSSTTILVHNVTMLFLRLLIEQWILSMDWLFVQYIRKFVNGHNYRKNLTLTGL